MDVNMLENGLESAPVQEYEDEVPEVDEDEVQDEDEDNDIALLMQPIPIPIPNFQISSDKLLIYTLGRYNPVHEGHMASIMTAIKLAKENKGKALILLGNGAAGARMDNPLSFDLKKRIIENHINPYYLGSYELIEKTSPVSDVIAFIQKNYPYGIKPHIVHLTAKKEAKPGELPDAEKLKFINDYLQKAGYKTYSLAIPPTKIEGEDMSATSVRKFANENDYTTFATKYGDFYGIYTYNVYNAIRAAVYSKPDKPTVARKERQSAKQPKKVGTHKGVTRKGGKHKSGTRNKKRKRKGITKKRKPYKSISK
jgi:hypothetical protein